MMAANILITEGNEKGSSMEVMFELFVEFMVTYTDFVQTGVLTEGYLYEYRITFYIYRQIISK